jgi:hypothetical protein
MATLLGWGILIAVETMHLAICACALQQIKGTCQSVRF